MDSGSVRRALKQHAEALDEAIAGSPRISRTVGPALRRRLRSDDWIKSPMLVSFLRPMKPPSPLENPPEVHQQVLARFSQFPLGATSLYALESALDQFEKESVSGTENWIGELRDHRGYWLDKRLQSWGFEMAAMPRLGAQRITKLPKLPASKSPDYVVSVPGMVLVMDAKSIFGATWPFKILHIMLETLDEIVGWNCAGMVFVHPTVQNVETGILEDEVARVGLDAVLEAIQQVGAASTETLLTPNLAMSPRAPAERLLGLRAFRARLSLRPDDNSALFASLRTPIATICGAAEDAWEQCGHYTHPDHGVLRLDVAAIASENLPVVLDFGQTELALRQWLRSEVWPKHPFRAVCLYLTGQLNPIWLTGPAVAPWP
jgi:hypothetical protein